MSIYGLSEDVLLEARQQLAHIKNSRACAGAYSINERCDMIRGMLGNRGLTPSEIAEELRILLHEVKTALQKMRDDLVCESKPRSKKGGRYYVWSLKDE